MQDTITKTPDNNPSTRAVELIGASSDKDKIKRQIIDEEMTHAAEILSAVCREADIPRVYQSTGDDLVDPYGVSLTGVLQKGVAYLENSGTKKPGWQWELARRKIEQANVKKIISAPEGVVCVEISPTDLTKPKSELLEYGYTGDTLVRFSYKQDSQVFQRNIIVKTSDIKTLNALRVMLDRGSAKSNNAEEFLSNMIFVNVEPSMFESYIADFKNFAAKKISKTTPARYILSIIRSSRESHRNAWDIVSSHNELFEDMYSRIEVLVQNGAYNTDDINMIRAGVWQCLIERSSNRNFNKTNSIDDGITIARSVGAVFTSCGGTVYLDAKNDAISTSFFGRYETAMNLINKISGYGNCQSCGSLGFIYGCGVYCQSCNRTWCDAYLYTGKQLSNKEVAEKQYLSIMRMWLF